MKYRRKDYFILREVSGDKVLIPRGKAALELQAVFVLNETGAYLWDQLEEYRTVDELAESIAKKYSVEMTTALCDVKACIEKLINNDLLEMGL